MRSGALAAALALGLTAAGCRQEMDVQPKLLPNGPASGFADNAADRPLPANTVARTDSDDDAPPPPVTLALVERGRERFDIFCAPCHGRAGDGKGIVVQRGFPEPPSYHVPRLVTASAQHFFDVITQGYGVMYPYGSRVPPADRWAIIAYIRALQLSQNRDLAADLPAVQP
jgi:mono/diheme cytochrome c family protein